LITNFKLFEQADIENVRCNNCWWYGYDEEGDKFELNDENDEICPNCGGAGMLADVTPVDLDEYPDFIDYMKTHKPKKDVEKNNYTDNLENYYRDAYPEYFELSDTTKKYNI